MSNPSTTPTSGSIANSATGIPAPSIDSVLNSCVIDDLHIGHNYYLSAPLPSPPDSDEMSKLKARFTITLKDHIKENLSTVPVPASSIYMDLNETVLNQSVRRIKSGRDNAQHTTTTNGDAPTGDNPINPMHVGDDSVTTNVTSSATASSGRKEEMNNFANSDSDHGSESDSDSDTEETGPTPERAMDYKYDSSESSSDEDDDEMVPIRFAEMREMIENETERGNKRILVTAPGGRGKTTTAKKIRSQWSQGICLKNCFAVVLLAMRDIDDEKDLFENMLIQYPIIKGEFSAEELNRLKAMFRKNQDEVFWIIDGLDESASQYGAQKFLDTNEQLYRKSVFMMMTRSEGKGILGASVLRRAEFAMNDLTTEQCQIFVQKFPFSGKTEGNKSKKRERLLEALKENEILKQAFPIPINAHMICALYNDESFDGKIENQLDILDALLGMNIKASLVKCIEIQYAKETLSNKREELSKLIEDILIKNALKVFEENISLLMKLSNAIFVCNGNSMVGFQNLDEEQMREALSNLGVSRSDADFLLRLEIFERKFESDRPIFQFYHRNFRELIVSLNPSNSIAEGELHKEKGRLKDTHLSIFRCIIAQIQRNGHELEAKVIKLTKQLLFSCESADEYRLSQMACEIIQICHNQPKYFPVVKRIMKVFVKMVQQRSFLLNQGLKKSLKSNFLTVLERHIAIGNTCDQCQIPQSLWYKAVSLSEGEIRQKPSYNWPDDHSFIVSPLIFKKDDLIAFCLPTWTFINGNHVLKSSTTVHCRKPDKGLIPSPIPLRLIESPVALKEDWQTKKGFPGGASPLARSVGNKIIVWGGLQRESEVDSFLPHDVIHVYDTQNGTWSDIPARGDVPDPTHSVGSVVLKKLIYLFGGDKAIERYVVTNALFTLTPSGVFSRVEIDGDLPSPRSESVGWSHEEDLFFAFGVKEKDDEKGGDWSEIVNNIGVTNQVLRFDTNRRRFSDFPTTGSRPLPLLRPAIAKVKSRVFVYGEEFSSLNIKTAQWTRLPAAGIPRDTRGMSLSRASPFQILLVGGGSYSSHISNEVWMYNIRDKSWTGDQRLPEALGGNEGGLFRHEAVEIEEGSGVAKIVCLGGSIDKGWRAHPSHMIEFNIPR